MGGFGLLGLMKKVFNTTVGNSVENRESILVSDLLADALALCTAAGAGTLVERRPGAERE
jgi:hypothetical protein